MMRSRTAQEAIAAAGDRAHAALIRARRAREDFDEADTEAGVQLDGTRATDIRGLPARLIRRVPDTQAVVTRKPALSGEWRQLEWLMDSEFRYAIESCSRTATRTWC